MAAVAPENLIERAATIAREAFALNPQDSVYRDDILRRLGGAANRDLPARRPWAEAWQVLARAGLICREPGARASDLWFMTEAGAKALSSDSFDSAIRDGLRGDDLAS